MKQLRTQGIKKLTEALAEDALHLQRLSREDGDLQEAFGKVQTWLGIADTRLTDALTMMGENEDD